MKRALAFSRDAASSAAPNAASARETMPSRSPKPVLRLVGEARLHLSRDLGEGGLVGNRQVGEDLAIDVDVRPLEARHEHAIGHSELAHCRVDAGDPQGAELALLLAAVAVGILPRFHHRLLGDAVDVLPAAAEPLRLLQDLLVPRARDGTSLDSRHGALLTTSTAAWNGSPPYSCGRLRSGAACGAYAWWSSW